LRFMRSRRRRFLTKRLGKVLKESRVIKRAEEKAGKKPRQKDYKARGQRTKIVDCLRKKTSDTMGSFLEKRTDINKQLFMRNDEALRIGKKGLLKIWKRRRVRPKV